MIAGLAALLLALPPAPASSEETTQASTRVTVEVFSVGLGTKGRLLFSRREAELRQGRNPDGRARELSSGETALLHSTSWRWEPDGRIVLTYLAWARDGTLPAGTRPLPELAPPGPTDPRNPRPAEIRELDPLAHGLRHLSFLLRTARDTAVAEALGPRGAAALAAVAPGVAGELPQ